MAKPRMKPLAALDAEQRQALPAAPMAPLPSTDPDLCRERDPTAEASWASSSSSQAEGHGGDTDSDCNSWVEVRKQRVVIVIPPLPEAQPKPLPGKAARLRKHGAAGRAPIKNRTLHRPAHNAQQMMSRNAPPISGMDILLASALGIDGEPSREMRDDRNAGFASHTGEERSLDTADSSIQPKGAAANMGTHVETNKVAMHRYCRSAHADKAEFIGRPKPIRHPSNLLRTLAHANKRQCTSNSSQISVNESLRLVTLKKHLERAGGLKGWLCSLGLDQFKEAFGKKRWGEGELLQLQMEDLKYMGKIAVGPRRKLIWAIHHLSQQMM